MHQKTSTIGKSMGEHVKYFRYSFATVLHNTVDWGKCLSVLEKTRGITPTSMVVGNYNILLADSARARHS